LPPAAKASLKSQSERTDFKYVDTLIISDISKDISECTQFIGITMLFAVLGSVEPHRTLTSDW